MKAIVVGGGKLGYFLVKNLLENNTEVILIERDLDRANQISAELDIDVLCGDGSDLSILKEADIENSELIAAVTGSDEENLVVCQIAKVSYSKSKTIARINNPKNIKMFKLLGVDRTVCSTEVIANLIRNEMNSETIKVIQTFEMGSMVLAEMMIYPKHPWLNKAIKDIKIPHDLVLVSILRENEVIYPKGDTLIQKGDVVMVVSNLETIEVLRKHI